MKIAEGAYANNGAASPTAAPTPSARYSYDGLGRVTDQLDYAGAANVQYHRQVVYNANGQVYSDTVSQVQGGRVYVHGHELRLL